MGREPGSFALTAGEAVALVERALGEPLPVEHLDHCEYDARGFGGGGRRGLRLAVSGFFWDDVDRSLEDIARPNPAPPRPAQRPAHSPE